MLAATAHVRRLDRAGWSRYAGPIAAIEEASFSGLSRDDEGQMLAIVEHPRSVCFVALIGGEVAGYCLGAPLEAFEHLRGVSDDPHFGTGEVLYAATLAVGDRFRGHGLARRLKRTQIVAARPLGYRWVAGRNRRGVAERMWHLNESLGAHALGVVRSAYQDGPEPRECIYYHIDVEMACLESAREQRIAPARTPQRRPATHPASRPAHVSPLRAALSKARAAIGGA